MEESKTPESPTSAGLHVQPHHTFNPTTASVPIRTTTPPGTSTSTDTLQLTPIAATLTPRVSAHNFPGLNRALYNAPTATSSSMTNRTLKKTLHQSYVLTSTQAYSDFISKSLKTGRRQKRRTNEWNSQVPPPRKREDQEKVCGCG